MEQNILIMVIEIMNMKQTAYYPFGGLYVGSTANIGSDVQTHKYNGKELDRLHGLDLYDYGARQYDPTMGQFLTIDPLAEKYYHLTPYSYCGGNPVNAVDPDGRDWYSFNGTYKWYGITDEIYKDKDGNEWINVGHTYTDKKTNIYYSLFGQKYNNEAAGLKAVKKLDEAIINYAKFEASQQLSSEKPAASTSSFSSENLSASYEYFGDIYKYVSDRSVIDERNSHYFRYGGSSDLFTLFVYDNKESQFANGTDIFSDINMHGFGLRRYKGLGIIFTNVNNNIVVIGTFSPKNVAARNKKYYELLKLSFIK